MRTLSITKFYIQMWSKCLRIAKRIWKPKERGVIAPFSPLDTRGIEHSKKCYDCYITISWDAWGWNLWPLPQQKCRECTSQETLLISNICSHHTLYNKLQGSLHSSLLSQVSSKGCLVAKQLPMHLEFLSLCHIDSISSILVVYFHFWIYFRHNYFSEQYSCLIHIQDIA